MPYSWIRVKCAELGITQKALFEKAGVDYMRGSRIINGFQHADPEFLRKIQAAFRRIEFKQPKASAV